MTVTILKGDVLEVARSWPTGWFDAVLCDPPYGLRLMNHHWDYAIPSVDVWRELLRVLKPGAPLLSFGGSRTFHRIWCAIEDGGFELNDTIMWCYGQGMPKPATTTGKYIDKHLKKKRPVTGSRTLTGNAAVSTKKKGGTFGVQVGTVPTKTVDVTGPGSPEATDWEGHGQALAPAHEPIALACKPLEGTIAKNVLAHDVGALNVAGCRIGKAGGTKKVEADRYKTNGVALEGSRDGSLNGGVKEALAAGRWPKNVILSHFESCRPSGTREVATGIAVKRHGVTHGGSVSMGGLGVYPEGTPDAGYGEGGLETIDAWDCEPGCPVRQMDEQSGERPSTLAGRADAGARHANPGDNGGASAFGGGNGGVYADSGGASRFFYHAKVSRAERELGCEKLPVRTVAGGEEGTETGARNHHATLKPIDLCRYLALLALPPPRPDGRPRRILIPFAGAGSEIIGALRAGWDDIVGIELDAAYIEIAHARIARWALSGPDFSVAEVLKNAEAVNARQTALFERAP